MNTLSIAYAPADERTAHRLAKDLTDSGYEIGTIAAGTVMVALMSPSAVTDAELLREIEAARSAGATVILLETATTDLPEALADLQPVSMTRGYRFAVARGAVEAAFAGEPMPTSVIDNRNRRWGLAIGTGLAALFLVYTWAIVAFDIEAPIEEFEAAYTRSAATVNAFAQPFVPQSTEQAENFESTLESREISDELATVIVATATQAAADGGFTPIPTGMIVLPTELSIVRQTATGGAIIRATGTANASDAGFEAIAATATQAAIDAEALDD
ncbi:MAG: hypothetical protein AAF125_11455 [Chloroflexota bacterium]